VTWTQIVADRLENDRAMLARVEENHREATRAVAMDPSIWRYFVSRVETESDFAAFFDTMLADDAAGTRVVYVVLDKANGRVAGSMSYGNLSEKDLRLEIGWSWLGVDFQGTGLNRQVKLLLLQQAFGPMGAERVEFKTDVLNLQARQGLLNIGAVSEGVLRSFNPMPDNRRRDAMYFSVLRGEWPEVEQRLLGADAGAEHVRA
jgi:RimJ/RimL family protein N-acetyltransferase